MGKNKNETIHNWPIVFLLVGVSTLDNRKISLTVSSLDAEEEVVVYMTLTNTRYPLGLLPGHVIRFRNLERRVSRLGLLSVCSCLYSRDPGGRDRATFEVNKHVVRYSLYNPIRMMTPSDDAVYHNYPSISLCWCCYFNRVRSNFLDHLRSSKSITPL